MIVSCLSFMPALAQDEELVLRVAMHDDIKTTNPLNAGDVWTWNVIGFVYDGPLNINPETEELIPYIAIGSANLSDSVGPRDSVDWTDCSVGEFGFNPKDTWTNVNKAEATIFYDFTNVKWHDGVRMTIRDLLFSYHVQAQMPDWTSSVNCLKDRGGSSGSQYPNDHKLYIDPVWESDDRLQAALKFTLQEPFADFFRNTLSAFLLPYHIWGTTAGGQSIDNTKIWLDPGYDKDAADAWSADDATAWNNPSPVGNGPFEWGYWDAPGGISKIKTWREHFYRLGYKYNPEVELPYIDAIVYKIYKTAEAAVLALKNDDVDFIAWSVPPTFVGELANTPGISLMQSPEQGFFYLAYNMRRESFGYDEDEGFPYAASDDIGLSFRKAVAHCIDKNKIVQRLLLCFGVAGEGPVSSVSSWYNSSIPKYTFDPKEAMNILADAGYQLTDGPGSKPGPKNWWLRPDGKPIGNAAGGNIEILTPQADYDPIRAQVGIMIAKQLRDIGVKAEAIQLDFNTIVERINARQFDVYILGWRIGSDPTDFLHAFFHSSNAMAGQNYPGYQNESFDAIIDHARRTGVEDERKQDIFDAQASVAYDLPYDVLYFRTNIEAFRSDNFVGWKVGSTGSIYNLESIYALRAPKEEKLNAQFIKIKSAMYSNDTIPVNVLVKDQKQLPVEGAQVILNATAGSLAKEIDITTSSGRISTTFTAPYVPPNTDNIDKGTTVIINIREATYTDSSGDKEIVYDPAPSKLALITVYPENVDFLSVTMSVDPNGIDPDVEADGTFGFTVVEVEVRLHTGVNPDGDPISGMETYIDISPEVPEILPATALTDIDGKARFTLTSTDLPNDDGSQNEFLINAIAVHPTDANVKDGEQLLRVYIVDSMPIKDPHNPISLYIVGLISLIITVVMVSTLYLRARRGKV